MRKISFYLGFHRVVIRNFTISLKTYRVRNLKFTSIISNSVIQIEKKFSKNLTTIGMNIEYWITLCFVRIYLIVYLIVLFIFFIRLSTLKMKQWNQSQPPPPLEKKGTLLLRTKFCATLPFINLIVFTKNPQYNFVFNPLEFFFGYMVYRMFFSCVLIFSNVSPIINIVYKLLKSQFPKYSDLFLLIFQNWLIVFRMENLTHTYSFTGTYFKFCLNQSRQFLITRI